MTTEAPESNLKPAAVLGGGIGGMFRDTVLSTPDAIALAIGTQRISYGELNRRANRIADHLTKSGLKQGDRVAILSENRREYVETILACAKLGLIAACQNWRQVASELQHALSLVSPSCIVVTRRFEGLLNACEVPEGCLVINCDDDYETLLQGRSTAEPVVEVETEDGLLILYTSGTTGQSKGALISHRAMIARAAAMRADWHIRRSDGFIAWSPLFHMASADPTLATLMQGGTVVLVDGFEPANIAAALGEFDIGWFVLMPGMIDRMAEELEKPGHGIRRIALAGCMANLVPPELIARITTLLNAPFANSFGSSETGIAPGSGNTIPVGLAPQSLGKRQNSFCEIKLVDENDEIVPPGNVGEICLRSPMLFSRYWNDPEATAKAFRTGWYHMGDDFVRRADGLLDFADRRKYLIKSGGENIYPAEIELALRQSPDVNEAIVVKRPDEHWGEVPVAFVVPSRASVLPDDILKDLNGRIARYKLPKAVILVHDDDLQRNATGKVRRDVLEQRALVGR